LIDLATKSGFDCYSSATLDIFDGFSKYINGDKPNAIANYVNSFEKVIQLQQSGLRKILNLDFDQILEADLLMKMDIATMANSLEGRSPLLGKELLEYVPTLSDDLKVRGTTTKYLLRELAKKYLPAAIIDQPKRGFEIPLKDWVDGQLHTIISDYIHSPNAYCRNFVKGDFIDLLMAKRINVAPEKRAKMIWTLFAMEVWYQKCYRWNNQ
jgi:asparagine synthase (glutamine-hydrolysing)